MADVAKINDIAAYKIKTVSDADKENIEKISDISVSPPPLFYFTFEAGSGATVIDRSKSSTTHNGAMEGSAAFSTTAKRGSYSLSLDNTYANYVSIADSSEFDGLGALTVAAWIKIDTNVAQYIITKGTLGGVFFAVSLPSSGTGTLGSWIYDVSAAWLVGSTDVATDAWVHIVLTWDGITGDHIMYVNGSQDVIRTGQTGTTVSNSEEVDIGRRDTQTSHNFAGLVDEFAFWNVAISAEQVATLYNSGVAIGIERGL